MGRRAVDGQDFPSRGGGGEVAEGEGSAGEGGVRRSYGSGGDWMGCIVGGIVMGIM